MTTNTESPSTESPSTGKEPAGSVEVQTPEFQSFSDRGAEQTQHAIDQFADIKISVSAELGRANIPIERLLSLGNGSVIELDRAIESPIELIAQGIPLASGEVVVVNDCFAIRITSVYPRNRKGETLQVDK